MAWSINKTLKQKLQILQNKTVRFILNLSSRVHIDHGQVEPNKVGFLNIYGCVQLIWNHIYTYNATAPMFSQQSIVYIVIQLLWFRRSRV